MDDFFIKFKDFYDKVKDITNVRFTYMKELYNLGIDQFPENYYILNIQKNNQASIQQGANKLKKNWTEDDKKVLIWLIGKYFAFQKRDFKNISETDWIKISSMMQRRDAFHCKQKWLQMLRLPLQQAPWTKEEDDALLLIIQEYQRLNKGNKWSQIATTLNKRTGKSIHRNGKQCRERWNNHLNPSINRKPWQLFEDLELMKLAILNGKKWAQISKSLKLQRSENNVKNRFNCLMRKERNNKVKPFSNQESDSELEDSFSSKPSDEELNLEELRIINQIIKKIEWRMKEDGGDPYDVKQEDFDQISKKISSTRQFKNIIQQQQKDLVLNNDNLAIQHMDNNYMEHNNFNYYKQLENIQKQQEQNTLTLQIMDFTQISQDEYLQLQSCLINKEKNKIYFATQEQIYQFSRTQDYLKKDIELNQGLLGHVSNPSLSSYNNLLSNIRLNQNIEDSLPQNQLTFQENRQNINSYFQLYPFNGSQQQYQGASQCVPQRSILNFPPNLNSRSFQQVPNYLPGLNYHLACYPQQQYIKPLQNSEKAQRRC
ncbi:unnamed protein product (macronuclear) [Paramecium tetraurelia]|uniref:Homeodomain protein n=1 Tax=Paramecium tetraurelia TaxID=5888 RepID=A0D678_PARTE|nr:uncharacterized protein GSPATT00013975001 [Paramecium tetraurelia]CAK78545.1 unnamed protein product [Paramecium tetraurelia]|eukprot:XP_001445942.1 hypothetical protein (macronuclear) [Paramecium tetraurelia strain d4-2]